MKKKIAMKCPLCPRFLKSQKCVLSHIARNHWLPVDLLPGEIRTRRRDSIGNAFLAIDAAPALEPPMAPPQQTDHVAVFEDAPMPQPQGYDLVMVAAPPLPPPPPPPPMDLVVYDENSAMRLPLKKRIALIFQMHMHHPHLYICHKCGRGYMKPSALGGQRISND